ncbi:hypothetical protein REK76_29315 (plasmid) [Nocardia farcinica]|uniref:hypothetical protein n=1 Tax=Nocardia farcinica TaxID=37329 RepID=UPI001895B162|nr:hypothetical protein [Nocardia farcinica]MBF6284486.1 hypothetical protein [Nocardia farcinica]
MIDTIEEYVMLVAYPTPPAQQWPAVDIFGGEVIFAVDGTFEGYERGQWWESVVLDSGAAGVPAALDDIDTELTRRGYTRTSRWHGPKLTRRGERYIAGALARIEAVK